jgi:hypothetical protein
MAAKLWNTGVDKNGHALPLSILQTPTTPSVDSIDPHWSLIQWPANATPQSPPNVYVLADQLSGTYFSTQDSRWVWASADGHGEVTDYYVFQTRFYLETDFSQHYANIEASWGTDNYGYITINNLPLPPLSASGAVSLPPGEVLSNFEQASHFSISNKQSNVFRPLWNTLEVHVFNEGTTPTQNPSGFNISAAGISLSPRRSIIHHGPPLGP